MEPLKLPPANPRILNIEGREHIYDVCRQRYVRLTPEEWVRQHMVFFLHSRRGVPRGLIAVEKQFSYRDMVRRADLVIYDRKAKPVMIIECKAPVVAVNQATVDQAARYNIVIGASYLVVTNGLVHYCCKLDQQHGTYTFLDDIPDFDTMTS